MDEVFVFEVEDIDADSWLAEVAVVANSRQAALRKIRDAGLHKKQIHRDGQPVHTHHVVEFDNTFDDRATVLRRRLHESGWAAWEKVPPGISLNSRISGKAQLYPPRRK
jgi:hypothetical protein